MEKARFFAQPEVMAFKIIWEVNIYMESKDRDRSRVKGQCLTLSGDKQENKERKE
jgi:hypothetical protein